jgi:hypothetical protein
MLGFMSSAGAILLAIGVGMTVAYFWERVLEAASGAGTQQRFAVWLLKGFGVPVLVWFVFNTGWVAAVPPWLGPQGGATPGSAAWVRMLPERLGMSVAVMASWWGAVTLAWLGWFLGGRVEDRRAAWGVGGTWAMVSLPALALVLFVGGWLALGFGLMLVSAVVLQGVLPLGQVERHLPLYSRAQGHIKLGRYGEAEQVVLEELEQCPDDYEGWMLLAELYAEHFHDLDLADQAVRDLCDQPGLAGIRVSLALNRLADWHLKLAEDPAAARRALEGITERLPESHFERMARQRIAQLPRDREELRERREPRPIRLPTLVDPLDDESPTRESGMTRQEAAKRANRLVAKLQADPNDPEPREELARLLVDPLDRVEDGLAQVRLLLDMPVRPPGKVPEWLAMMASWHLRRGSDREKARAYLEELVRGYPHSPQAFAARRRLNVMDLARRD